VSTDPKTMRHDGSERRPSGAESKGEARADPGGHRSRGGSNHGDWVPDRGQPRRNDDRDADPQGGPSAGDELGPANPAAATARDRAGGSGATAPATPGPAATDPAAQAEAAAESNRNKDFDTPHVHSGTTTRRV
jgi:hypothetical protein